MHWMLSTTASAQEEFTVYYDTTYTVSEEGSAQVEQEISLTNNFSKIYASSYSLKIEGKKPQNISVVSGKEALPTEFKEVAGKYEILISFPEALVGRGKTRVFTVRWDVPQIATRNGKVWEASIPKLASSESVNGYNLTLKVPANFGLPAYISPQPRSNGQEGSLQTFSFQKDDLTRAGVVATFGDFQVFSFNLNFHLQNTTGREVMQEIALVPDTAFQRAYYENLVPEPISVRIDEDGNWLAKYNLAPKSILNVSALVFVDVFAQPQEQFTVVDPRSRTYYLAETDKWQVNNSQVSALAKTLKTPRAIYDYVVSFLNYDYSRVQEGAERYGAVKALANPEEAICVEFTDLFIAIARAAGIPAREINGYAYTENPELQPLSLVADVLHAWPEYWDSERGVWRPVDPTWEDTTGGIDFFDKFDLSHVTFAIHGKNTDYPAPAGSYKEEGNKQKDIVASFGTLNPQRTEKVEIAINQKNAPFLPFSFDLPFVANIYEVTVKNTGPVAIYGKALTVEGGKTQKDTAIDAVVPYSTYSAEVSAGSPFFPFVESGKLIVKYGGETVEYSLSSQNIIISRLVLFLLVILLIIVVAFSPRVYLRLKKFHN